ncbi:MAG: zinc-dependent metalloprotease [Planctomycetaceae bacterium]|jgi:hypothetical protein|nr:zinc-dependent metalloprotease [Planctomycetaceae bacterium]
MLKKFSFTAIFGLVIFIGLGGVSFSQNNEVVVVTPSPAATTIQQALTAATAAKKDDKPKPIKEVLPDAEKIDGLITLYRKKERLLAEIKGSNLNTDYLIAMAVAKGSGASVIGGYTLGGPGDDKLWQFRKVGDKIHIVRRNIKFKANPGTPEELAVDVAYSDNTIYSLPIIATGDNGGDVIDFGSIFMSDLPAVGMYLGSFARDKSYWGNIKGFQNNIEFRVVATYSGGGFYSRLFRSAGSSDSDGTTVTIHYSVSKLPASGYLPRLADNRIGYFTTSHKNYSKNPNDNHYVRYINRWNLQKADPSAELSPPKKPIIFWISKTVPFRYRKAVREGILEWNKAFEKIGFVNAIEVRQQADNDTWDAEDINYNTFRWITSDAHFAMGPSHVNPLTGEILDADIIFDAGFVDSWRSTFNKTIADVIPTSPKKISANELKNVLLKRNGKLKADKNSNNTAPFPYEHEHNHNHNHNHNSVINDIGKVDLEKTTLPELKNGCGSCSYSNERASEFAIASLLFVLSDEDNNLTDESNHIDGDNELSTRVAEDNNFVTENNDNDGKEEKKKDKQKKDEPKKDNENKDKPAPSESKKDKDEPKKNEPKKDEPKKDTKTDTKNADKTDGKKNDVKKPDRVELQKKLDEAFERFVLEGLKDVVMHEVGHTLGLRHNFKASSWLTLDEINDPKRSKEYGIAGSVMDYLPVNISPKGKPQGDYFMTTLGPYDYLAIEYGYKNLSGGTDGEVKELQAIASRQAEKGKHYAPDEDAMFYDDPLTIRRDLGSRPLDFARSATELYNQLLPQVVNRAVKEGESYKDVSGFFFTILSRRIMADYYLARNVGGQYRNRDRRGDPGGRLPVQVVDAKTQRESVDFLCKTVLAPGSFSIPADLYNKFGEEIWLNDGRMTRAASFDIRELFLDVRLEILSMLVSPYTLARMYDAQFRLGNNDDVFTVEELFDLLSKTIFNELDSIGKGSNFSNKKPAIDIQQRDLQNTYVFLLSLYTLYEQILSDSVTTPTNAQPITKNQLIVLSKKIDEVLKSNAKLDVGSRLHLENTKAQIEKTLNSVINAVLLPN